MIRRGAEECFLQGPQPLIPPAPWGGALRIKACPVPFSTSVCGIYTLPLVTTLCGG